MCSSGAILITLRDVRQTRCVNTVGSQCVIRSAAKAGPRVSEEENPKEAKARRAFGKRLKDAREAAGLSQVALGDKCDWLDSQSRISMYETGKRWPTPLEVAQMASFVDATPGHLLFGEPMPAGPIVQLEFKKEHRVLLRQILNLPDKFQDALRKLIAESDKLAHPRRRTRAPTETVANEEEKQQTQKTR